MRPGVQLEECCGRAGFQALARGWAVSAQMIMELALSSLLDVPFLRIKATNVVDFGPTRLPALRGAEKRAGRGKVRIDWWRNGSVKR
jgi:hypothetical protein